MENKRDYKRDYKSLKRLHDSANSVIISLQHQMNELQEQLKLAMAINVSLEKQININKGIMHETLTTDNRIKNEQINEIQRLREVIKELKHV